MKVLVIFYSRADENYFDGEYRCVSVGNTEKLAQMISQKTGAAFNKGLSVLGNKVEDSEADVDRWLNL